MALFFPMEYLLPELSLFGVFKARCPVSNPLLTRYEVSQHPSCSSNPSCLLLVCSMKEVVLLTASKVHVSWCIFPADVLKYFLF